MGENQAKGNLERDKILKMKMDRPYTEARKLKYSKERSRVEPTSKKKKRKTQEYMAKHSDDGSRTSREELAGNKSSEQEQDPMVSFHKGPMPL
jgi:ribosome assembly protein YihI (activator of Der GTPase)